jgi:hypothetical protein
MGTVEFDLWYPAPVGVFGAFLAIAGLYIIYRSAKFIISVFTGTS